MTDSATPLDVYETETETFINIIRIFLKKS